MLLQYGLFKNQEPDSTYRLHNTSLMEQERNNKYNVCISNCAKRGIAHLIFQVKKDISTHVYVIRVYNENKDHRCHADGSFT